MPTAADLLAHYRARLHATAVAEHVDAADLDDPHGDDARGVDPDTLRDRSREDHL